jgi:hypothetical protein
MSTFRHLYMERYRALTSDRCERGREKCVAVMQTHVQCTGGKVEKTPAYTDNRNRMSSKQM